MAQTKFRSDDTDVWAYGYGLGEDGAYAPSTGTDAPIDSAATGTINTNSLSATNASFQAGQFILIHQTRGTNAGEYELNKIQSYVAGTITTVKLLKNTYGAGAQVIVIPRHSSAIINTGVTITLKAWNGTVGGIYVKAVNGTFDLVGTLNGNGKGFLGQAGVGGAAVGKQGEGNAGAGGAQSTAANGNGAGGGGYSTNSPWNQGNGGGGGGSIAAGSNGIGTGGGNNAGGGAGVGGAAFGNVNGLVMTLGGAGGSGGTDNNGTSSASGNGAGLVFIFAKNIPTITGSMTLIGAQGAGNDGQATGSGGSGGGGGCLLKGQTVDIGVNKINVSGGTRVFDNGSTPGDRDGGAGGNGGVHVDYSKTVAGSIATTPGLDSRLDPTLADAGGSFFFSHF